MGSIVLDGTTREITVPFVESDVDLSQRFASVHPALSFIYRHDQIPEPVLTEASLAAMKVIDKFQAQRKLEARTTIDKE